MLKENENKFYKKKSLGQNFLKTESILDLIADSAEVAPGDLILEIGPGLGALTEKLLERVSKVNASEEGGGGWVPAKLLCIEKDHRLIDVLNEKFKSGAEHGKIKILEQDILKWGIDEYFGVEVGGENSGVKQKEVANKSTDNVKYKLIANIPYYITGAIIEKFLSAKNRPEKIVIMVQKEVADRVVDKGGKGSILSLATKLYGESKIIKIVKPGNFNPPPKIDSAVLEINLYKNLKDKYNFENSKEFDFENFENTYLQIVKKGLAHKRKMLIPNLKDFDSRFDWTKLFTELNIENKMRGEDLPFEKWLEITREYILLNNYSK